MRLERAAAITAGAGLLFQFHKGAIRTDNSAAYQSNPSHFNSIKVRLEQYARDSLDARVDYFNSIKVRLELCPTFCPPIPPRHFNSIKVRLER